MINPGTIARERFIERMQAIKVGARLKTDRREWLIVKRRMYDGSTDLHLQCGRHSIVVNISISHSGPDLWHAGLSPSKPAPLQRELSLGAAC